jgi:hypothetical protein
LVNEIVQRKVNRYAPLEEEALGALNACWFLDTDYNGESFFVRHASLDYRPSNPLFRTIARSRSLNASGRLPLANTLDSRRLLAFQLPYDKIPSLCRGCGDTNETSEEDIDANSMYANSCQLRVRGRLSDRRWQRSDADQREWLGCRGQAHLHLYSDGDHRQPPGCASVEARR